MYSYSCIFVITKRDNNNTNTNNMKTSKYNRSEIMKNAWALYRSNRSFNWSFSKCLTISWNNAKVKIQNEEIRIIRAAKEAARIQAIYDANMAASRRTSNEDNLYATMASYYANGAYSGD